MRERMMTLGGLDPFTRLCSAWTRQRGSLNHVSAELDSRTHEMDEKWIDFPLTPQSHVTPKHAGVRGEGGRLAGILVRLDKPYTIHDFHNFHKKFTNTRTAGMQGETRVRLISFFFKEK